MFENANSRIFKVLVALNQLLCAVLLFPFAKNRETVCGLVGRYSVTGGNWAKPLAKRAARVLERGFHKQETCIEIYRKEQAARRILYG